MDFPSKFLWAGNICDFFLSVRFCHRRRKTHAIAISVVSLESMVPSEVWALILSKIPPAPDPPRYPPPWDTSLPRSPENVGIWGISKVRFRTSRLSESRSGFAERLHWCAAIRMSLESSGGSILERPVAISKIPGGIPGGSQKWVSRATSCGPEICLKKHFPGDPPRPGRVCT